MKRKTLAAGLAFIVLAGLAAAADAPDRLWYRRPAGKWTEALPVGNGRMGAMVFGGIRENRIQFNEYTVWTGRPHDYAHPGASEVLPELRRLVFAGKGGEASRLASGRFMSVPLREKAYQPCGDLFIRLDVPGAEKADGYRRELDLAGGAASSSFTAGGVRFERETFAPYTRPALLVHAIRTDRPGALSCGIRLSTPHKMHTIRSDASGRIALDGQVEAGGVSFSVRGVARVRGASAKIAADGAGLRVTAADSIEFLWAAATNVKSWQELGGDPAAAADAALDGCRGVSLEALRSEHSRAHRALFGRVSLSLPEGAGAGPGLPTDERLARFSRGPGDPAFAALVFQYGRYLLIACSRPGGQPATLQGIWNESLRPPWESKYTCNINTEMNYWPAEVAALPECHEALFAAIRELAVSGARTAKAHYGARGWALHHNFDLWRGTAPVDGPGWGLWPSGGGWLSLHLWERYLYTLDKTFLRETAWPVMRGAARFYADTLVEHPATHELVTCPSMSPEHGGLVAGPAMDSQIVRSLFRACIEAAGLLGCDRAFADELRDKAARIPPNRIGRHGQLQEWMEDKDDPRDKHRHFSHLWGVYPGSDITWKDTPALFRAAMQSMRFRGDAATGWSMGWKVNVWARFLDGDHALTVLSNLLRPQAGGHGGLYPNLFDAHPPFQIDGNFGAAAGIAEMLLQSHIRDEKGRPVIHVLPALPSAWKSGAFSGLRARGGFSVDAEWKDGKTAVTLTSLAGAPAVLKIGGKTFPVDLEKGAKKRYNYEL